MFDKGKMVYDLITPFLMHQMISMSPRDMLISCRGASGQGEHVLHVPDMMILWCSRRTLHLLRSLMYNEIIVYVVPEFFEQPDEFTVQVLPNLGLRVCTVRQETLDRHKAKVAMM
jgi:hypothetical protein